MVNPLVSILIPFKNVEEFLEECLESICSQTYQNWEVLAINDQSDDNSLAIAKRFSQLDNRFKIFTNTESGIITALRKAYEYSSGDYITRMDADDHMTVDRIQTMLTSLKEKGKGFLAIGQVKYFAENGVNDGYDRYEKWLNQLTADGTNFEEIYKECVIPSPCWMVHKTDFHPTDIQKIMILHSGFIKRVSLVFHATKPFTIGEIMIREHLEPANTMHKITF